VPSDAAADDLQVTSAELANVRDGSPERFVPGMMRGQLIEADHLARYHWASQFASGKRVLDAGCGAAYGSTLLAEAGADHVVGVDLAVSVVEAFASGTPPNVELEVGDVRALRHDDGAFDLIACFEVIEHVEDPRAVLDSLHRVLAPGGVLVVSTPDRDATVGRNPHHLRELTRDELAAALSERFAHVRLLRQDSYLGSAILPEGASLDAALDTATVRSAGSVELDVSSYVIAAVSDAPLPDSTPLLGMTSRLDFRTMQQTLDAYFAVAHAKDQFVHELQERVGDRAQLQEQLLAAENKLVTLPELAQRLAELSETSAEEIRVLTERVNRAARVLRDVQSSPSWKITKPLRSLKHLLGA